MNPASLLRVFLRFVVTLLVLAATPTAHAYMYFPQGIDRPIVRNDRVYFKQADGRMTVIDLADGHVIQRPTLPRNIYRLEACEYGLLAFTQEHTHLLDWLKLDSIWTSNSTGYSQRVGEEVLVLRDFEQTLAIEVRTGRTIWSIPGYADELIVVNGRALIVQEPQDYYATKKTAEVTVTVWQIEVATGQILDETQWTKKPWQNLDFLFDGDNAYAIDPGDTYGRPDSRSPENILAWRIEPQHGLADIEDAIASRDELYWVNVDGQRFDERGMPIGIAEDFDDGWVYRETGGVFRGAGYSCHDESLDWPEGQASRLRFAEGQTTWRIVMPHVRPNSDHLEITAVGDDVLIATSRGQLECLYRKTGESRWLYVSPWTRGTMSYTGNTLPFLSTVAGEFDQENKSKNKRSASRIVPASMDWKGLSDDQLIKQTVAPDAAIHIDPTAFDPFAEYRDLLRGLRFAPVVWAVLVVGSLLLMRRFGRFNSPERFITALFFFALPLPLLWYFGRVSFAGSVALLIEMLICSIVLVYWTVMSMKRRQMYIWPSLNLAVLGITIWWWAWPVFRWVI